MIKTITIGDKKVRLDNNIGWTMEYKDQFGTDIIPTLMPLFASAMDIISDMIRNTGKTEEIDVRDIMAQMDGDTLTNAAIHLSGFELNDFIQIVWALAKNADSSIPEPKEWVKQFDVFPLDVLGPEVFKLIAKGFVSTKNLKRLSDLKKTVQMEKQSTLRPFSSQVSNVV